MHHRITIPFNAPSLYSGHCNASTRYSAQHIKYLYSQTSYNSPDTLFHV